MRNFEMAYIRTPQAANKERRRFVFYKIEKSITHKTSLDLKIYYT